MTALSVRVTLAALTALTLSVAPAQAQWGGAANGAHTEGYRDGVRAGHDDARDGRRYEYQRHRDYRSADTGYQSRDGRRDDYREQYRGGFMAGYRDGFYSSGRRPSSGGSGRWSGGGPWNDRDGRAVVGVAQRHGADDGYERGLGDGRDGDRFDVRRHGRYRDGDRGYRRDYGSKALYQDAYRNAFERAYRAGFDDGQRRRRR